MITPTLILDGIGRMTKLISTDIEISLDAETHQSMASRDLKRLRALIEAMGPDLAAEYVPWLSDGRKLW